MLRDEVRAGDVVVITIWFTNRARNERWLQKLADNFRDVATFLETRGANLVIIGDVPLMPIGIKPDTRPNPEPWCTQCWARSKERSTLWGWAWHEHIEATWSALATERANVHFFSPFLLFCNESHACDGSVPGTGMPAYRDTDHLSTYGSLYLAPFLNCFLRSVGILS